MRTLIRITIPVEAGNKAINDGRLARVIGTTIEKLRPEASYFLPFGGKRSAIMIFDLKDPSEIPQICEPLFGELNAEIELAPVMNGDDLKAGLASLGAR